MFCNAPGLGLHRVAYLRRHEEKLHQVGYRVKLHLDGRPGAEIAKAVRSNDYSQFNSIGNKFLDHHRRAESRLVAAVEQGPAFKNINAFAVVTPGAALGHQAIAAQGCNGACPICRPIGQDEGRGRKMAVGVKLLLDSLVADHLQDAWRRHNALAFRFQLKQGFNAHVFDLVGEHIAAFGEPADAIRIGQLTGNHFIGHKGSRASRVVFKYKVAEIERARCFNQHFAQLPASDNADGLPKRNAHTAWGLRKNWKNLMKYLR